VFPLLRIRLTTSSCVLISTFTPFSKQNIEVSMKTELTVDYFGTKAAMANTQLKAHCGAARRAAANETGC